MTKQIWMDEFGEITGSITSEEEKQRYTERYVHVDELREVVKALKECHNALDGLFALLIVETATSENPFYPSQSGQPWKALSIAYEILEKHKGGPCI